VPRLLTSAVSLLALLGILTPLQAVTPTDIFIYRGTVRTKASVIPSPVEVDTPPAVVRAYLVVDYTRGQSSLITYYAKNGKKQSVMTEHLYATRGKLPNGRLATFLANASSTPPDTSSFPPNFAFAFRYLGFRGQDASLRIETLPAERNADRPRVLKGVILSTTSPDSPDPQTGRFSDLTFTGTLDSALTIGANNTDKDTAQVTTEISARLTTQGYEAPLD
jgi:hypothetical protein